jgi:hypothetical protein
MLPAAQLQHTPGLGHPSWCRPTHPWYTSDSQVVAELRPRATVCSPTAPYAGNSWSVATSDQPPPPGKRRLVATGACPSTRQPTDWGCHGHTGRGQHMKWQGGGRKERARRHKPCRSSCCLAHPQHSTKACSLSQHAGRQGLRTNHPWQGRHSRTPGKGLKPLPVLVSLRTSSPGPRRQHTPVATSSCTVPQCRVGRAMCWKGPQPLASRLRSFSAKGHRVTGSVALPLCPQ